MSDNNKNMVSFDREKAARLQKEYDKAVETGAEQFTFDGHELVTGYAYYMLEYLRMNKLL